jgi:hypothetical protein
MREPIHSLLEAARSRNPRKSDAEADEDVAENSLSKGREAAKKGNRFPLVPCSLFHARLTKRGASGRSAKLPPRPRRCLVQSHGTDGLLGGGTPTAGLSRPTGAEAAESAASVCRFFYRECCRTRQVYCRAPLRGETLCSKGVC